MDATFYVSGGALGGGRSLEDAYCLAGVCSELSFCSHIFHLALCIYTSSGCEGSSENRHGLRRRRKMDA